MLQKFSISGREKDRNRRISEIKRKNSNKVNNKEDKDNNQKKENTENLNQEILNSLLRIGKK